MAPNASLSDSSSCASANPQTTSVVVTTLAPAENNTATNATQSSPSSLASTMRACGPTSRRKAEWRSGEVMDCTMSREQVSEHG
jgi:hypothetical protein